MIIEKFHLIQSQGRVDFSHPAVGVSIYSCGELYISIPGGRVRNWGQMVRSLVSIIQCTQLLQKLPMGYARISVRIN